MSVARGLGGTLELFIFTLKLNHFCSDWLHGRALWAPETNDRRGASGERSSVCTNDHDIVYLLHSSPYIRPSTKTRAHCELRLHYLIGPLSTLESWSVTVASLELLCGLKVCRLSIKCTRVNTKRAHVQGYCFISIVKNGPRTSVDRYQCQHTGIDPSASRARSQVWLNKRRSARPFFPLSH